MRPKFAKLLLQALALCALGTPAFSCQPPRYEYPQAFADERYPSADAIFVAETVEVAQVPPGSKTLRVRLRIIEKIKGDPAPFSTYKDEVFVLPEQRPGEPMVCHPDIPIAYKGRVALHFVRKDSSAQGFVHSHIVWLKDGSGSVDELRGTYGQSVLRQTRLIAKKGAS